MKKREKYLVFGSPLIGDEEIGEVVDCLKTGWLGTGPKVARFEKAMAEYKGVRHAVAVNSCTAALHLSCLTSGLRPGDEVITSSLTFCATVNAIIHSGATPVLADVDPLTQNLSPTDVEARITEKTKAILPVHFAGRPCDMDSLRRIALRHNLILIEDCAHAIETEYRGQKAGTFGKCAALSFYATKNLVTGEGGMLLTNDDEIAARAKMLALHGMSKDAWKRFSDDGYQHYDVVEIGFKYNMMDLQAAIGLHQLHRLESNWKRRQKIWEQYNQALTGLPLQLPPPLEAGTRHAFHLYTVLIDPSADINRDQFLTQLHHRQIGTGVHYRAIPEHPVYQKMFGWRPDDFPHARKIGLSTVSLPLSPKMTDEDMEDVIAAVIETLQNC